MASLIPRKGPHGRRVWQAHIRRRGYPTQVRTFDTKAEAEAWAAVIESEIARGVFVSRVEAEQTTLADALDRYRREVLPAKRSQRQIETMIRQMSVDRIGSLSLAACTSSVIADYRDRRLKKGVAAQTAKHDLALLSRVFNLAAKEWGIALPFGNPVSLVKMPRIANARDRRLVDDEETRLLAAAATYGGEIGPIITWAIETAMRRGEIAAMRWEHLDRKARVLLIPETKTGTPRRVPLSTAALGILDTLPRRLDGKVWGIRPDSISQAFERVCKAAGIEGLTFHDLRHEATSRLFEKGLNPMQVAAITGHKTLQMLKRYTHLRAEDVVGMLG
ncbi:site-specific integrase [Acidiferrobacter sp.]|uniref:tyrosine-type recombinase/integrase n=1 Tax=Acidiferrobacter sp. TaxID=1872107 RepID=UPI002617734D|nr:site-specific integrase [Acidiferrobacter sp.]